MIASGATAESHGPARLFNWRRMRNTLIASLLWGLMLSAGWQSSIFSLLVRTMLIGLVLMLVFGLFERWPARLPRWCARWVLQVLAVAMTVPVIVMVIYVATTPVGQPAFYRDEDRMGGYALLTGTGLLFAPWVAMTALLR